MSSAAISILDLVKDFRAGMRGVKLRAVDHLSLEIPYGSTFGLLGPNGSGKSTTLKILLGLHQPTRGQCTVLGHRAGSLEARRRIGYLPEAPYFYRHLTGKELLYFAGRLQGLPQRQLEHRTTEVLKLANMTGAASRRVGTYSKGMLQRIGLAQALIADPALLILDEPTAGLDPLGAADMARLIQRLKAEGKSILLCSHLLAEIEGVCDRVAILNQGKLLAEGRLEALLEENSETQITLKNLSNDARIELQHWLSARDVELVDSTPRRLSLQKYFVQLVQK
jgi:ABC-2 type transport system ATP-binding protein